MTKRWTPEEIDKVLNPQAPLPIIAKELGRSLQAVYQQRSLNTVREIVTPKKKKCSKCNRTKKSSAFNQSRTGDGLQSWCRKCNKENNKKWYIENKDHHDIRNAEWYLAHQDKRRTERLRSQFKITPEEYDILYNHQGGSCALCPRIVNANGTRLHVDHDRRCCSDMKTCGACIRGLLCRYCNIGVGYFESNKEIKDLSLVFTDRILSYLDSRIDTQELFDR